MAIVSPELIARIFFIYGLAFFCMGLAILLELSRIPDPRLRNALQKERGCLKLLMRQPLCYARCS